MLKTRIITAVVLLLAFSAALAFASKDLFALILALVVAASAWEWCRMSGLQHEDAQSAYAAAVGVLSLVVLYLPHSEHLVGWLLLTGVLFWLSVPALFYLSPHQPEAGDTDHLLLGIGLLILCIAALSIQYLRSLAPQASGALLLYALSVVWCMDIGAYFSGRRFGRTRLAPTISPGKTREGVYGGLLVTALLMLLVMFMAEFAEGNRFKLLVATLLAALASVLGDLYESRIKRAAGVKDSSQLLPGHGGVMDRLDGVVAALPVFAFIWAWL